ncbi:uncharacterized protein LOC141905215 isoform X2 [Tubulanus polymorphus]|uniref:uncharacterized protein LOC141905215 isoform X2 n=1 Tax=Tubulanus polymorphus TaxID=672921 RepID=UPI003DA4F204
MGSEAVEEYRQSLSDLTFNSKPQISMLTMLADENQNHAQQIVQVIETHIQKSKPLLKLPALYLIDSIIKNVHKSSYIQIFTQNIVFTFCHVFEKGDEKTRVALFKLRQTWSEIFPQKKLYAIDIRVRAIDPAWPVMAKPPDPSGTPSIHVNPKFIKKQQEKTEPNVGISPELHIQEKGVDEEAAMRKQLLAKQQELLKLQQQQLELELQQTKARIEQQQQQLKHKEKLKAAYSSANLPLPSVDPQLDMIPPSPEVTEPMVSEPVVTEPVKPTVVPPRRRDPRLANRDPRLETKSTVAPAASVTGTIPTASAAAQGLSNLEAAQMLAHQLSQIAHTSGVKKNTLDLLGQLQAALTTPSSQQSNNSTIAVKTESEPASTPTAEVEPRFSHSEQYQTDPSQYQNSVTMMQMPMMYPGQFPSMPFQAPVAMTMPYHQQQMTDAIPATTVPLDSIPIPPSSSADNTKTTDANTKTSSTTNVYINNKKGKKKDAQKTEKQKEIEAWKEKKRLEENERLRKERERIEFKEREKERERIRRQAVRVSRRSPERHSRRSGNGEEIDEFGRIKKPRPRSRSRSRDRDSSSRRGSPRDSKEKVSSSRRESKDSPKREDDKSKKLISEPAIKKSKPFKSEQTDFDKTLSSDSDVEKLKIDVSPSPGFIPSPTPAFKDIIGKIVKDSVERMQERTNDIDEDLRKNSKHTGDIDMRVPAVKMSDQEDQPKDRSQDIDLRKISRFEEKPNDIENVEHDTQVYIDSQDVDMRKGSLPQIFTDNRFKDKDLWVEPDKDMRKKTMADESAANNEENESIKTDFAVVQNPDVGGSVEASSVVDTASAVEIGGDVDMRLESIKNKSEAEKPVEYQEQRDDVEPVSIESAHDTDLRKRPSNNPQPIKAPDVQPIESSNIPPIKASDTDLRSRAPVYSTDLGMRMSSDDDAWQHRHDFDMRPARSAGKDVDMRLPAEEFRAKRVDALRLVGKDEDIRARLSQWAQRDDDNRRTRPARKDSDTDLRCDQDLRVKRDRDIDMRSKTADVTNENVQRLDEEPPVKKQRSDTDDKENISDDDSFKGKDQDYRQPGKITNAGWAKFKASHPDEFPFQQPQEMELLKSPAPSGDFDMRMAPPLMANSETSNEDEEIPQGEFSPDPVEERRGYHHRREFSPDRRRRDYRGQGGRYGGRRNSSEITSSIPPPIPPPGAPIEDLISHQTAMLKHLNNELYTKNLHPHKRGEIKVQMERLRQMRDMLRRRADSDDKGGSLMPPPAPPAGLMEPLKDSPKDLQPRRAGEQIEVTADGVELVVPGKPILHTFTHLPPHIDPAQLPFGDENNLEDREEVVIDRRTFEIRMGQKSRRIELGDEPYWFRVDPSKRQVFMNDRAVYKIGTPMKEVKVGLRKFMICYRGPVKKIWIDGMQFDVRLNGPPQKIFIDNTQHDIRIDGFQRNEVYIDGIGQGPFGGSPRIIMIAFTKHEIRFDQPRREILIDGKICQLHLDYPVPVIFMGDKPHGICFDGPPRDLYIDSKAYRLPMDNTAIIRIGPRPHRVAFLGPGHEVMIDGRTYEVFFDAPPREINISGRLHNLSLKGPPPEVKILDEIPVDPATGELLFVPKSFMEANKKDKYGRLEKQAKSYREYLKKSESYDSNGQMCPTGPAMNMMGMPGLMNPMGLMMGTMPGMMNPMGMMMTPDIRMQMMQGMANPMMAMNPMMAQMQQQMMMQQSMQAGQMMPNMMNQPVVSQQSIVSPQQPAAVTSSEQSEQKTAESSSSSVNVMDLLNKLKMFGMLNEQKKKEEEERNSSNNSSEIKTSSSENVIAESESLVRVAPIPDLTSLDISLLRKHHAGVIQRLYLGIQCSSCGVRFVHEDCERYRLHLDWHFRLNKRGKDDMKIAHFRKWFFDAADWVDFVEIQDEEEKARKNFFARSLQAQQEMGIHPGGVEVEEISCPAATGRENDDVCEICRDPFEQFWDEEAEEWHLKDAIRVDNKTYHPVCYEDANVTLLLETPTPTPEVKSQPFFQTPMVPTQLFPPDIKSENAQVETKPEDPIVEVPPANEPSTADNPELVTPKVEPVDVKTETSQKLEQTIPPELLPPTPMKIEPPEITTATTDKTDTPTPPGSPVEESSVSLPGTRIPFPFPSQSTMQSAVNTAEESPVVVVMKPEDSANQINVISSRLPKFFPK